MAGGVAKGLSLSLRGKQLEDVQTHADRGGMSLQDAVRELVALGLSVAPHDTLIQNARQRAYDDTRRYTMRLMSEKMTELSRDVEKTLGLEIWGQQPPRNGG